MSWRSLWIRLMMHECHFLTLDETFCCFGDVAQ